MEQMTRIQIEEALISNDVDTVEKCMDACDYEYIMAIFLEGFKGYANFTDEELVKEYGDIFDKEIKLTS
jgi:hypothetical protein